MKVNIEKAIEMAKQDPNSDFSVKLRKTIESGVLDKAAFSQGFDLTKFGRPAFKQEEPESTPLKRLGSQIGDLPQDIQKTGQNIKESFNRGMDRVDQAQDRTISGEQSLASGTFQTLGAGASTGAAIIGDLFIGAASLITTPEEEEAVQRKLMEGVQAIGKTDIGGGIEELAEQYNAFKESNPTVAANLEASLGFAEAILEVTGAGAGLKATKRAVNATGDAVESGVKQVGMALEDITPDFQDLVQDLSPKQITESGLSKKEILAGIRPDIKKSIEGQEAGIQEYFDVTRKRLEDETAITPTGLLAEKAEGAFKQVEKQLTETGSSIGGKRDKLGSTKASNDQTKGLVDALDTELKAMGLTTTKSGGVVKGKGIVDVSDAEMKLIQELKTDLQKVRGDAKVATIQKAINKFRNRVNFGKSAQEVSGVMDGLLKKISSKASDINKTLLGKEAAGQYAKYGELIEFLKDTKNIRKNPQVILRRILSSDSSKGLQFAETIKELTGVDLIKESRFAKLAVDTFGEVNPELGTRFRQQLTDSGVAAGSILSKAGGKAGAIGTVLELVRDIPKAAKREFLLRKGINPAQIDADELAEIILESARGSQSKAVDIVEDVVKTGGKTQVGLGQGVNKSNSGILSGMNKKTFTGSNSPLKKEQFAILTAENPMGKTLPSAKNIELNKKLVAQLKEDGFEITPVTGHYGANPESSFIVKGMTDEQALKYGKMFNQDSVLTPKGLIYQDGTVNPADLNNIDFDSKMTDFFTEIQIDGEKVKFSIPIDFDKKVRLGLGKADDLVTQAKKFDNVDEFIDELYNYDIRPKMNEFISNSNISFRGVPDVSKVKSEGFRKVDLDKIKNEGLNLHENSVYFANNPSTAIEYGYQGRGPTRYSGDKSSRGVISIDLSDLNIKKIDDTNLNMNAVKDGGYFELAQKEGFDGIESPRNKEIAIWNTDKLNQLNVETLEDIFNQTKNTK
jgi:hypothetical protein